MKRALIALTALPLLAAAAPHAALGSEAGPLDCLVQGFDDKCEAWVSTVDHPANGTYGHDQVQDALLSPNGSRLFVTGTTAATGSGFPNHDVLTVAIDTATGTVAWKKTFDGDEANDDHPAALAISPDGSRVFVGATVNDTIGDPGAWNADFGVIAYDAATGTQQWVQTYNGFELQGRDYGNNQVEDIAVAPDGQTVYITGPSLAGATRWDYGVFAYDAATGAERWRARYDRGNGDDRSRGVFAVGDRVYVIGSGDLGTGTVGQTDGNQDLVIVAYEAADAANLGKVLWTARRDSGTSDTPAQFAVTPSGDRILVITYLAPGGGKQAGYRIDAYRTDSGDLAWTTTKAATTSAFGAAALAVSPTGDRFYVTGTRTTPQAFPRPRDMEYATTAFSLADGAEAWTRTYGVSVPEATEEEGLAVAVNPAGTRVYVTGYSSEVNYTYIPVVATVAYDAAGGTQLWVARHRRPTATLDHDRPVAALVSPTANRLFIGATFTYRPDPRYQQIATSDLAAIAYDTCEQVCPLEEER